jgi:hypothetical protein
MSRKRVGRTNDQVLLAEFDSTMQASHLSGTGWFNVFDGSGKDAVPLREALGKLRLEALLSKKIVLTDAQALDGRVLLALAASGLLEWLRTDPDLPLPLLVRTREPHLGGTLAAMFGPGEGESFRSSFLTHGPAVARALADVGTGRARVGPGDARPLLEAGAVPDEVAALVSGWRALDGLVARHALGTAPWDATRPWSSMLALSDRYHPLSALAVELGADEADTQAILGLGEARSRSTFLARLDEFGWDPERSEVLRTWFDERYRRAVAFQHRADYRSVHAGYSRQLYDERLESQEVRRRVRTIDLPDDALVQLGELTPKQWQDRYGRAEAELKRWWGDGDVRALDSALRVVVPEPGSAARPLRRYSDRVSFGLGLSAGVVSLSQDPNLSGILTTVVLNLGLYAATSRLGRPPSRVSVTDYLDDVEPKAPS